LKKPRKTKQFRSADTPASIIGRNRKVTEFFSSTGIVLSLLAAAVPVVGFSLHLAAGLLIAGGICMAAAAVVLR
jgi:hypothetical protein